MVPGTKVASLFINAGSGFQCLRRRLQVMQLLDGMPKTE